MSLFQVVCCEFIDSLFEGSTFFLFVVTVSFVMKACFRAIAAWFSDPTPAQATASVTFLALNLYTGFNIPEPYMTRALRWITHINVRIPRHVRRIVRLTACFFVCLSAGEVCVRVGHDKRVWDA